MIRVRHDRGPYRLARAPTSKAQWSPVMQWVPAHAGPFWGRRSFDVVSHPGSDGAARTNRNIATHRWPIIPKSESRHAKNQGHNCDPLARAADQQHHTNAPSRPATPSAIMRTPG
jgi:hypothetical protein